MHRRERKKQQTNREETREDDRVGEIRVWSEAAVPKKELGDLHDRLLAFMNIAPAAATRHTTRGESIKTTGTSLSSARTHPILLPPSLFLPPPPSNVGIVRPADGANSASDQTGAATSSKCQTKTTRGNESGYRVNMIMMMVIIFGVDRFPNFH